MTVESQANIYFIGGLEYHINNDSMCSRKITESIFNKYVKNIKF